MVAVFGIVQRGVFGTIIEASAGLVGLEIENAQQARIDTPYHLSLPRKCLDDDTS